MTGDNFFSLFAECTELRQYIIDAAKSLSSKKRIQKELVGHAWAMIGKAPPQRTTVYYKRFAYLVMEKRLLLLRYGEVIIT